MINSDNLLLLNQFADAVRNNKFFFVSFGEFDINKDMLLDLQNIDLINDMFSLNIELSRVNKTLTTTWNWYSDLKTAFVDEKITEKTYKENMNTFSEKLNVFVDATVLLGQKIEKTLAKVRVLLDDEPLLDKFLMLFSWKERYPKDFEKKCEKELEKIRKEVGKIKAKSQSEIDALKPEEKK